MHIIEYAKLLANTHSFNVIIVKNREIYLLFRRLF